MRIILDESVPQRLRLLSEVAPKTRPRFSTWAEHLSTLSG
jgi:hypothetical protein